LPKSAKAEDSFAVDQRGCSWRVSVVESTDRQTLNIPNLFAGLCFDAAKDIVKIFDIAVTKNDVLICRGDTTQTGMRQRQLPKNIGFAGQRIRETGDQSIAMRTTPAWPDFSLCVDYFFFATVADSFTADLFGGRKPSSDSIASRTFGFVAMSIRAVPMRSR